MVGRRNARASAVALSLVLVALVGAAPSVRAVGEPGFRCRDTYHGTATTNPNPKGKPPLAIGDSTMNLPLPNLTQIGFSVNARGCRGTGEANNLIEKLGRRGKLPHLVVVAVYSNGGISLKNIAELLDFLGKRRVLGLVTEYNADNGRRAAPDTGVLFKARRLYPRQVAVLDWVKYSLPHHFAEPAPGAWFLPDRYHPNYTGAQEYANFLARLLPYAREGRHPH
jgi:hypothetical protein